MVMVQEHPLEDPLVPGLHHSTSADQGLNA